MHRVHAHEAASHRARPGARADRRWRAAHRSGHGEGVPQHVRGGEGAANLQPPRHPDVAPAADDDTAAVVIVVAWGVIVPAYSYPQHASCCAYTPGRVDAQDVPALRSCTSTRTEVLPLEKYGYRNSPSKLAHTRGIHCDTKP